MKVAVDHELDVLPLERQLTVHDLGRMIYTSGSTRVPPGRDADPRQCRVQIGGRGRYHRVDWQLTMCGAAVCCKSENR